MSQSPTLGGDRFADDYSAAVQRLRGALVALVRSAGGDPTRPQDLSRQFGLNRNLTWKISRFVASESPVEAIRYLPGSAGLRIVREALAPHGDPEATLQLEGAESTFDFMVARHAGDRASLDVLVQGLAEGRALDEPLEQHRRQGFLANGSLWGVQATTQITLTAVAPARDGAGRADVLNVGGLVDFRRLRSDTQWLFFSSQTYDAATGTTRAPEREPLEPLVAGAPLLTGFCSEPLPELRRLEEPGEVRYELPPGPVGNTALLTAIHGSIVRSVGSLVGDLEEESPYASFATPVLTPVEHTQVDLLLHEDLGWTTGPEFALLGRMDGRTEYREDARARRALPSIEQVVRLGRGTDGLASARYPRTPELARHVLGRAGWDPARFVAWRVPLVYPPPPSTALLTLRLPRGDGR